MRRLALAAATIAAAALALAPARAGDSKEAGLVYKFSKGEKVRYAYSYDFSRTLEVMGMPQAQTQKLVLTLAEECTDATADAYAFDATIERITVSLDMGAMMGGSLEYDSAKARKDKPAKPEKKKKTGDEDEDEDEGGSAGIEALGDVIGSRFAFRMGHDGAITELTGLEAITAKLAAKGGMGGMRMPRMGQDPSKMLKALALPATVILLTPDVVKQTLELHCHVLPKDGAAAESWTLETAQAIPGTGELVFKRTFTPKGDAEAAGEKGTKLLHAANKPKFQVMKIPGGAGGGDPMANAAAAMGKQKMKEASYEGSTVFSKDKGRILSDELVETMTTETTMKNPFGPGKKGKKKPAEDEDDEDAPKKKDEGTKEKKGEGDEEDGGDDGAGGMKLVQKFRLKLRYDLLTGDAKAPEDKPADEKKPAEEKKPGDEKKKDDKGDF